MTWTMRLSMIALLLVLSVATLAAVVFDPNNRGWWAVASLAFHIFLFTAGTIAATRWAAERKDPFRREFLEK